MWRRNRGDVKSPARYSRNHCLPREAELRLKIRLANQRMFTHTALSEALKDGDEDGEARARVELVNPAVVV